MADAPPGAEPAAALTMRGIIGVMGGLVLYMVISEVLETALVAATSEVRPTDVASYYAARNRPAILGAKLAYNTLTALLAGYMTAKVAGEREMVHGRMAAFVQTVELAWRFLAGDTPASRRRGCARSWCSPPARRCWPARRFARGRAASKDPPAEVRSRRSPA